MSWYVLRSIFCTWIIFGAWILRVRKVTLQFKRVLKLRFKRVLKLRFKSVPQSRFKLVPQSRFKRIPQSRFKIVPQSRFKIVLQSRFKKIPRFRFKRVPTLNTYSYKVTFINPLNAKPTKWSSNLLAVADELFEVWVCLAILWGWHLKG